MSLKRDLPWMIKSFSKGVGSFTKAKKWNTSFAIQSRSTPT